MTRDEIKIGTPVMTPHGKAVIAKIDIPGTLVPFLVEYPNKNRIWYSREFIHPIQPEPPTVTPLFTATERRDRVWDLAASLWASSHNIKEKQCVELAESLTVEFEATYNKEHK